MRIYTQFHTENDGVIVRRFTMQKVIYDTISLLARNRLYL
jgi:hypothetical protein